MNIIAKRYAQAFFDSSKDDTQAIMFKKGLSDISELFCSNKEFKTVLLNPCVSIDEKMEIIKSIFSDYFENKTFINFLFELLNKKRIGLIKKISDEFSNIYKNVKKEITIKIIVAKKISEKQVQEILEKYKNIYNADKIDYKIELDESIIGGIRVEVGNRVYDNTISTQLNQLF